MGKPPPPPSWPAEPIGTKLNSAAPITIELFLDLICPFSMKMFCALYDGDMFAKLDGKVCFVFQNVPQPWHPQTVYLHEVSLLVKKHSPAAFAKFVRAVYKEFAGGFGRFFDEDTYEKSRKEIYAELVELAGGVGADKEKIAADLKLMKLVLPPAAPKPELMALTEATTAIKWAVQYQRKRGVHTTPTVFVNGIENGICSSGWDAAKWELFLEPLGADGFTGSKLA